MLELTYSPKQQLQHVLYISCPC